MNLFQLYLDAAALQSADAQQRFIDNLAEKSVQLAEKLKALLADTNHTLHLADDIRHAASRLQQLDISGELTGKRLGYWQLDSIIAHGGMSTVYLASRQDGQFEQQVAIKVLNPLIYPVTPNSKAFAEANVAAKLNHPGITKVFDAGITEHQGQQAHYIVMEYIEGQPLNRWLESSKPSVKTLVRLFIELCDALHYAHTYQIIHADLKPENILVDEHGKPKLIDFGIARLQQQSEQTPAYVQHYVKALSRQYASPEQLSGEPLTTLSDVYSLGKVLAHTQRYCKTATQLNTSELAAIIEAATKAEPERRFQSILHFLTQLTCLDQLKPVDCYKAGVVYRMRKFVLRQPALSVALGICITLLGFAGAGTYQYQINLHKEQQQSKLLANFMTDIFQSATPLASADVKVTAEQLLDIASYKVSSDKTLSAEHRALLQAHIAKAYIALYNFDAAEKVLQISATSKLSSPLSNLINYLQAETLLQKGDKKEAVAALERATEYYHEGYPNISRAAMLIRLLRAYSETNQQEPFIALQHELTTLPLTALEQLDYFEVLAQYYADRGQQMQLAADYIQKAADLTKKPELYGVRSRVLLAASDIALLSSDSATAETLITEAEQLIQKGVSYPYLNLSLHYGYARLYTSTYKSEMALLHYQKALPYMLDTFGPFHEHTITLKTNICDKMVTTEKVSCFEEVMKPLAAAEHKPKYYSYYLRNYAIALRSAGNTEGGIAQLKIAVEHTELAEPENIRLISMLYNDKASFYASNSEYEKADYFSDKAIHVASQRPEDNRYFLLRYQINKAMNLFRNGKKPQACSQIDQPIADLQSLQSESYPGLFSAYLVQAQCKWPEHMAIAKAITLRAKAMKAHLDEKHPDNIKLQSDLAEILADL